jgi:hypothetical protein
MRIPSGWGWGEADSVYGLVPAGVRSTRSVAEDHRRDLADVDSPLNSPKAPLNSPPVDLTPRRLGVKTAEQE